MAKIFISYRREDSQHAVDRLQDVIRPYLRKPKTDLFVDVDNIPKGSDFEEHLNTMLGQSDAVLAIIGPSWVSLKTAEGTRRIQQDGDFVRMEIASALKRDIPVVPVLLDGTKMPTADMLPEDLKPLTKRNAAQLDRKSFRADVKHIMSDLGVKPKRRGVFGKTLAFLSIAIAAGIGGQLLGLFDITQLTGGAGAASGRWDHISQQSWSMQDDQDLYNGLMQEVDVSDVEKAARAGNGNANVIMGIASQNGTRRIAKDTTKASEYYGRACDSEFMRGCNNLASLYYYGLGVPQNPAKAKRLFSEACEGGIMMACTNLAFLLFQGAGTQQDFEEANRLLELACDRGFEDGCTALRNAPN